ncbi:hypothetical protein [Fluviicola sp.]|uniref:hypothetical protein n=1 Tax=Fluviicola sp. TaxID=1917219 RepID=UPI0031CFDCAC
MNKLKKAFVLFLVLVVALPDGTVHAFSFIPKFITHYNHHNREHHKIGLIAFIGEHLRSNEEHDRHEHHGDEQENCPFSHNHTTTQLIYILRKEPPFILANSAPVNDQEKSELPDYRFTFSEYNGSIWQPPKI